MMTFLGTAWSAVPDEPQTPTSVNFEVTSKAKRKLRVGDELIMYELCDVLLGHNLRVITSFFIKTG